MNARKKQFYAHKKYIIHFIKMGSIPWLVQFHAYQNVYLLNITNIAGAGARAGKIDL